MITATLEKTRKSLVHIVLATGAVGAALLYSAHAAAQRGSGRAVDARGREAVVMLTGDLVNKVVGPLNVVGPFRAVESSKSLRARNLLIRNIAATGLQRDGIRLRGDIDGARVQNFRLQMRSEPQTHPNLPIGIALVSGRRMLVSDGLVQGFRMERVPGRYTNGDGIAAERKVQDLTIRGVTATDNSDAGFDLKSSGTRLDGLRAERNGRNYRFWSTVDAGTLTSIDPRSAHVWISKGAKVRIRRLVARSSRPVSLVQVEEGGVLVIDSCELQGLGGVPLVEGASSGVRLGRGCGRR